jgi:hypothetical protein
MGQYRAALRINVTKVSLALPTVPGATLGRSSGRCKSSEPPTFSSGAVRVGVASPPPSRQAELETSNHNHEQGKRTGHETSHRNSPTVKQLTGVLDPPPFRKRSDTPSASPGPEHPLST